MRDRRPNSDDVMQNHCILAVCAHNTACTSKKCAGKVGNGCLGRGHGWFVSYERRVDTRRIASEWEQVGSGDIKWDEQHAREWQARSRGYQHLVDGVWVCEEID